MNQAVRMVPGILEVQANHSLLVLQGRLKETNMAHVGLLHVGCCVGAF